MRRGTLCALLGLVTTLGVAAQEDPKLGSDSQQRAPTAFADDKPRPVLDWGAGARRSYWVPALDIVVFDYLLNQYNRYLTDVPHYDVTAGTIEDNLTGSWVYDSDPFDINQFGHP